MQTFHEFLKVIVPYADRMAEDQRYTGVVYHYTRGAKKPRLEKAYQLLSQHFSDWESGLAHIRVLNGFFGVQCKYGTMPCTMGMTCELSCLHIWVVRGRRNIVGESNTVLFNVTITDGRIDTEGHFENLLK